jgi:hypothetical protein
MPCEQKDFPPQERHCDAMRWCAVHRIAAAATWLGATAGSIFPLTQWVAEGSIRGSLLDKDTMADRLGVNVTLLPKTTKQPSEKAASLRAFTGRVVT